MISSVRMLCSNNTNKLSPQEHNIVIHFKLFSSNNTNKLSPQEHAHNHFAVLDVQIIQINLVLKNDVFLHHSFLRFK